jgi:hypothetical protein
VNIDKCKEKLSIKSFANLGKCAMETLVMIRRKHEPYTKSPNSPRSKKARQVKSKAKSMLIIFFEFNGIIQKKFALAGQTVNSAHHFHLWCMTFIHLVLKHV